jgi:hypothetical protein
MAILKSEFVPKNSAPFEMGKEVETTDPDEIHRRRGKREFYLCARVRRGRVGSIRVTSTVP